MAVFKISGRSSVWCVVVLPVAVRSAAMSPLSSLTFTAFSLSYSAVCSLAWCALIGSNVDSCPFAFPHLLVSWSGHELWMSLAHDY